MGVCGSSQVDDYANAAKKNKDIGRQLKQEKQAEKKILNEKLLLLGPGGCGKSTFLKSVMSICGSRVEEDESMRAEYVEIIRSNLENSMRRVFQFYNKMNLKCEKGDLAAIVKDCDNITLEEMAESWDDFSAEKNFTKLMKKKEEMGLLENAEYFWGRKTAIMEPDFKPVQEDVLRSRKMTTAISETVCKVPDKDDVNFTFVDVGGQRGQRRKWIRCFEDNITAVMYLASLNDYFKTLEEDKKKNRMEESLELFTTVLEMPWFASKGIFLFLNKWDLFQETVKRKRIEKYFKPFKAYCENKGFAKEGLKDPQTGFQFFKDQFVALKKQNEKETDTTRKFYAFQTCAIDPLVMDKIFNSVTDMIFKETLSNSGFQ